MRAAVGAGGGCGRACGRAQLGAARRRHGAPAGRAPVVRAPGGARHWRVDAVRGRDSQRARTQVGAPSGHRGVGLWSGTRRRPDGLLTTRVRAASPRDTKSSRFSKRRPAAAARTSPKASHRALRPWTAGSPRSLGSCATSPCTNRRRPHSHVHMRAARTAAAARAPAHRNVSSLKKPSWLAIDPVNALLLKLLAGTRVTRARACAPREREREVSKACAPRSRTA